VCIAGVTVGVAVRVSMPVAVRVGVRVAVSVAMRAVAVTCVCSLRETAQSHDAETDTTERQTERVGVHGWV
jgi:hypothetical protein